MKKLYIFFDHEWGFDHCQTYSKQDFDMATSEGITLQKVKDQYSKLNTNGQHSWFLDEIIKDEFVMSSKIGRIYRKCGVCDKTIDNIINTFTNKQNYKGDGYGNYLVAVEVEDADYKKLKNKIDTLAETEEILSAKKPKEKHNIIVKEAEEKVFGNEIIR